MEKYKSFEELKEELGENYDRLMYDMNLELIKQKENTLDYVEHLIRDAKYHLNLGHLKKLKKLLKGE